MPPAKQQSSTAPAERTRSRARASRAGAAADAGDADDSGADPPNASTLQGVCDAFLQKGSELHAMNPALLRQAIEQLTAQYALTFTKNRAALQDTITSSRAATTAAAAAPASNNNSSSSSSSGSAKKRVVYRKYKLPGNVQECYQCMVCGERRPENSFHSDHVHIGIKANIRWYCPLCDAYLAVTHRGGHIRSRHRDADSSTDASAPATTAAAPAEPAADAAAAEIVKKEEEEEEQNTTADVGVDVDVNAEVEQPQQEPPPARRLLSATSLVLDDAPDQKRGRLELLDDDSDAATALAGNAETESDRGLETSGIGSSLDEQSVGTASPDRDAFYSQQPVVMLAAAERVPSFTSIFHTTSSMSKALDGSDDLAPGMLSMQVFGAVQATLVRPPLDSPVLPLVGPVSRANSSTSFAAGIYCSTTTTTIFGNQP